MVELSERTVCKFQIDYPSFQGHEPDNEDSDQSEGSYLPHRLSHRQVEYLNLPTGVTAGK